VYSILATAGYGIDDKTNLSLVYTYSWARNFSNNGFGTDPTAIYGMPFCVDYDRHAVSVGLSRQLSDKMAVQLSYSYYSYSEPSNGGIDNYTAHVFGGSCTVRF
jgi:hypothetical protein